MYRSAHARRVRLASPHALAAPFALAALAAAAALLVAGCSSAPKDKADATSGASAVAKAVAPISESVPPVDGAGRVLVVYYSQGDAARRVAEDLAALTGADVEAIASRKAFKGYMVPGMYATFGWTVPIAEPAKAPKDYEAVFVVTPVWSWSLCPPVRAWLRGFRGTLPRAAFVTVSGDTEPGKIVKAMAKEGGREPFAFAGFSEKHFLPENREAYAGRIAALVEPLRSAP